jgi:hypothetical protein
MIFEQPLGYLLILVIITLFILGLVRIIIGFFRKKVSFINSGLFIAVIPILIVGFFILYSFIYNRGSVSYPNEKELVGVYHLVGASKDVEEADYKKCRLVFKYDGKFILTPIPYVNDCGEGSYYIDREVGYGYTLSMGCGFESHIDTNWDNFQVRLIFGDNDLAYEERSFLVFEKIPAK